MNKSVVQVGWDDIKLVCGNHSDLHLGRDKWRFMNLIEGYPMPRYDCPENTLGEAPVCKNTAFCDVYEKLMDVVGEALAKEHFLINKTFKILKAGSTYRFKVLEHSQTEIVISMVNITRCGEFK
jgi:hypothetical protein